MTYALKDLTDQEVNILIAGLGELQLKLSGALFTKIRTQVEEQQAVPLSDLGLTQV